MEECILGKCGVATAGDSNQIGDIMYERDKRADRNKKYQYDRNV